MNRSELAGLLAQTLPVPKPSPTASRMYNDHMNNPILSPKQQFQSQVRKLNIEARPSSRAAQPPSNGGSQRHRPSQELQHVTSLRVQHKRAASTQAPSTTGSSSSISQRSRHTRTAGSLNDVAPDFSAAEREVWSKKSPPPTTFPKPCPQQSRRKMSSTTSHKQQHPILRPPSETRHPIPQPRKQAPAVLPLRQIEPLHTVTNTEERPKTSRGLGNGQDDWAPQPALAEGRGAIPIHSEAVQQSVRRSKFLEGSMNDRSMGISSSWYNSSTSDLEDAAGVGSMYFSHDTPDTDSDVTPRASHARPASETSSAASNKQTPLSPFITKKGLLRFSVGSRTSEESFRSSMDQSRDPRERRGLRKSLSIFNLRDKMKVFGGGSIDAASNASSDTLTQTKPSKSMKSARSEGQPIGRVPVVTLYERKRKAEEAYARQFGIKKRKSSTDLPVATPVATNEKKLQASKTLTITPKTLFYRKRDAAIKLYEDKPGPPSISIRKRPSRKDLEKENQQLKAQLRETQSMTLTTRSSSLSNIHFPGDNFGRGTVITVSPGKRDGSRGSEEIPPVPKLPGNVEVLQKMSSGRGRHASVADIENVTHEAFGVIPEEDESEVEELCGLDNADAAMGARPWEWPDDVF